MEKWYALMQCGIVYEILHCTENQIKLKAARYNQQSEKFYWSYEEV